MTKKRKIRQDNGPGSFSCDQPGGPEWTDAGIFRHSPRWPLALVLMRRRMKKDYLIAVLRMSRIEAEKRPDPGKLRLVVG